MKLMVQIVVLERLCIGRSTSMDLGDGGLWLYCNERIMSDSLIY